MSTRAEIQGTVARGFERVRDVFAANFAERGELGAACSVVRRGEVVVDLWGGVRDARSGAPCSFTRARCRLASCSR
ncbi:MAG: beta-lactamase family protein [Sandaracinaceae bacterium]|nr:beta-lactamase family protein [Sandaracinaceae bacterium]